MPRLHKNSGRIAEARVKESTNGSLYSALGQLIMYYDSGWHFGVLYALRPRRNPTEAIIKVIPAYGKPSRKKTYPIADVKLI